MMPIGPIENDMKLPRDREGPLWDFMRSFEADGFSVDARSYATCFRIGEKSSTGGLVERLESLPQGAVLDLS
jgi:hypothetical protein